MKSPEKKVVWPLTPVSGITMITFAGYACLQLSNVFGSAMVSLQGAQVLSWVPAGQREVFWLSPSNKPVPAAIRGGVPVCWPWFSKQGMPSGGVPHGLARNVTWRPTAWAVREGGTLFVRLIPDPTAIGGDALDTYAEDLDVQLEVELGPKLRLCLQTHNRRNTPFTLTQALHSYYAVGDVEQVQLEGVEGLVFESRLDGTTGNLQMGVFNFHSRCDNTYVHASSSAEHEYRIIDPSWQRQICLTTQGSQSVVVWNPGEIGAAAMADVPDAAWKDFFCVEASNAGLDAVVLAPGTYHQLAQTVDCLAWASA